MEEKHKARVLIIDDEADLRKILGSILSEHFTKVVAVGSYDQAIAELKNSEYDVIICDYKIGGASGLDIRKWQFENQPNCQFILLTGYADDPGIVTHMENDYFRVLQKPAHPNEIIFPLKKDFPEKKVA